MESLCYDFSSLGTISTLKKPPLQPRAKISSSTGTLIIRSGCSVTCMLRPLMPEEPTSPFSYKKFVHFALEETKKYTNLSPSPLQENISCLVAMDGKTELQMVSFESPKIRLLRSLSIEGSDGMQVLSQASKLSRVCKNFKAIASYRWTWR